MSPTSFAPTFPLAHRRLYRSIVVHNILHDILALADRSAHFSPIQDPGILPLIDNLRRFAAHDPQTLTPAIAEQIVALWNDKNIQITFQRRAAFHMHDTAAYLVPHSLYIAEQGDEYVPSDLDVLVCHFRTTGIVDAQFQVGEQALRIVDVGGQRNERAKWPLLFEQTSAIIYVFGISEIDRLQREDDLTPRLHEALNLFSDLVQTPSLRHVPIILCFTKPEQLELNLQMRMNMTSYLESYNGDPFSAAPILEFVCFQFLERAHNSRDRLYVHTCSPFDAKHVHVLFDSLPSILRSHKRTKSSHA